MPKGAACLLLPLLIGISACQPAADSHAKAIIGAVLIDGMGGPPLTNSVVVYGDGRILQAGRHGEIPVSTGTSTVDGSGKFVVPGLVDIAAAAHSGAFFSAENGPATPDDARARIALLPKTGGVHIWPAGMQKAVVDALLESARNAGFPITGHPVSQADAQLLVGGGASVLIGMIRDTDDLDADFVSRLRDLRIVYAPALSAIPPGPERERAGRNTQRLFAARVPLAVASSGGAVVQECELMADAGVPPLDVIVAATSNGARALHADDRGAILPGKRADFLLLRANPAEDIRNLK